VGEGVAEGLRRELAADTGRPDLALGGEARPLDGGNSAALFAFEVADPPPGLEGPLVLRLPSGPAGAERTVHAAVTAAGYPAPALRLDGDGSGGLGRPFLVMDRVDGRTPLDGFNLLVRDGRVVAVLDWELAGLGPPELDVARTELILATLPGVSAVARRLLRGRSARVATAFTDAYRARAAVDEGGLRWFGALHAARLLAVADGAGAVAALWRPVRPALADRVRAAAG
jgi:aminoglycoside phosphotransferase (APT) family kinase protein